MQSLPPTTNFVFWDKHQPAANFADGELAWTSFKGVCKKLDHPCFGAHGQDIGGKIHPTQKPVKLYDWLLTNYAKPEHKILDAHLGSGSHAIAAHYYGIAEFVGCELDPDYYASACQRIITETKQELLF
jgi:site-specific DNA-methyltransferase (adenine-specific)